MKKTLITVATLLAVNFAARAADEAKTDYPLTTCVVSGEDLGGEMGEPYIYHHEGREIRFCCKDCVKDFKKDPAQYLKKLDDAAKGKAAEKETAPDHQPAHSG